MLSAIGKKSYESMLARLKIGQLTVVDGDVTRVYGDLQQQDVEKKKLTARLTVNSQQFYARLAMNADIGFAESFILGEIDIDNLTAIMEIFISNRDYLNNLTVASAALGNFVHYLSHTRLANTLTQSMNNISAHYDLGNELFTAFLDDSMMYSSAVWAAPEESLYDAQMRKVNMLINKARLGAGDEVLEIGTGWGTLAIEAVRQRGCRVTTVTLSKEQKRFTEDRLAKLPVEISSRIQVLLCDYRRLPELFPNKRFDKIISIEMIEAVGPEFLTTYFQVCHQMLHPEHGIMAFQCITMPESRYESYKAGVDFIQRYIFPGGHCPSVTALVQSVHEGSAGGHLMVDDLENIGPHYARTLRVWRERFLQNFDSKLKAFEKFTTRQKQLSTLTETISSWLPWTGAGPQEKVPFYSEEFKRKWVYYLSYCEAGFATRTLGNVQMVLTRVCNRRMLEGEEQVVL